MMFVKQRRILIMMLVVLFTSVAAQAQLKFGLTAGMRFDRLKEVKQTGSSILGDDYNMNGYYVGLKLDLNTPVGFGVDLGVNFCNRNINDDNEWECPQCHNKDHSKMNVTRRTCGYLGENFWNTGKTKEIKSRVLHL